MKHILLIGGDARSIEVIRSLSAAGHQLSVIGFNDYEFTDETVAKLPISTNDLSSFDSMILPIDGLSPNGEVNCPYAKSSFVLSKEMVLTTPEHCKIFTGIANDFLKEIASPRQLEVIFSRNDIALYNSIPTAEATLKLAIEQTDFTIHDSSIAILGFGRVGFTVAKLFQDVGANVTVFIRSDEDFARSNVLGVNAVHIDQLTDRLPDFPIYINTIPQLILDEATLAKMSPKTLIIDLASKPGGTDFKAAETHGIKAIHALGLPGKTAPKTAGNILAETILKLLST